MIPKGRCFMGRLLKAIIFLVLLGFAALVGYAYVGDMSPVVTDIIRPVTLDGE